MLAVRLREARDAPRERERLARAGARADLERVHVGVDGRALLRGGEWKSIGHCIEKHGSCFGGELGLGESALRRRTTILPERLTNLAPQKSDTTRGGTIPDDDPSLQDRARRAEDVTRRLLAAVEGALEGFTEALDEFDVKNEAKSALEQAGEVSRAAATEAKTQAGTPEMRQAGEQLRTAGHYVADRSHALADRTGQATEGLRTGALDAKDAVAERVGHARDELSDQVARVKYKAHEVKEDVKIKAEAVGETGRRAARAPGRIRHELGEALTAWKRGLMAGLAGMAIMAVLGLIALIVLTIAMVVGLNELLFDPAGTFLVAGIYLVGALVAFGIAKGAKARAAHEKEERIANAEEEVRHVGRPVREAFNRGRPGL